MQIPSDRVNTNNVENKPGSVNYGNNFDWNKVCCCYTVLYPAKDGDVYLKLKLRLPKRPVDCNSMSTAVKEQSYD